MHMRFHHHFSSPSPPGHSGPVLASMQSTAAHFSCYYRLRASAQISKFVRLAVARIFFGSRRHKKKWRWQSWHCCCSPTAHFGRSPSGKRSSFVRSFDWCSGVGGRSPGTCPFTRARKRRLGIYCAISRRPGVSTTIRLRNPTESLLRRQFDAC